MKKTLPCRISYASIFFIVLVLFTSCRSMKGRPEAEIVEPIGMTKEHVLLEDSVTVVAARRYRANPLKSVFQGRNYRKAWKMPIKVPVVTLDTLEGGMIPIDMGGGKQTLSMDLQGKEGVVYTLRSVNKDPEKLVPKVVDKLNLENVILDAMSAQHPYGAIWAAALSEAAGVLHTHPRVVYLPKQPQLDTFNQKYGDRLFLLEYEDEGSGKWLDIEGTKEIIDTDDLLEIREENPDIKIDKKALIRARLFDLLIGDWDRHDGQWGWIVVEKDGKTTYIPLPTDRDNAFYHPQGVVFWVANRPFAQEELRPFKKKIDHMPGMVKEFDQMFLLDVDEAVFVEVAQDIQRTLTDAKIDQAMKALPPQFVQHDGKHISKRVKARRDDLIKYAKEFREIVIERGPYVEKDKEKD